MAKIGEFKSSLKELGNTIQSGLLSCTTLDAAAQKFSEIIYENFSESIVLVRVFATVNYGLLPANNQNFVKKLATSKNIINLIKEGTPVLSLLGTVGKQTDWNSRLDSKGHVGIPLASSDFIESIPMMSRLLKELGIDLKWLDQYESEIVKSKIGNISGFFYVRDATTEIDKKGRHIIAAQDFVRINNIKTVFGFGGAYMDKRIVVTIFFTNELVLEEDAHKLVSLINVFKGATINLNKKERIFA